MDNINNSYISFYIILLFIKRKLIRLQSFAHSHAIIKIIYPFNFVPSFWVYLRKDILKRKERAITLTIIYI